MGCKRERRKFLRGAREADAPGARPSRVGILLPPWGWWCGIGLGTVVGGGRWLVVRGVGARRHVVGV